MGQTSSIIITNPKQCFTINKVFGFAPFGGVGGIRTHGTRRYN